MCAIDVPKPFLIRETDLDKPIILPSKSECIWEKFEYFDKNTEEFNDQYDDIKGKLLDLWWEEFQKEVRNETTK